MKDHTNLNRDLAAIAKEITKASEEMHEKLRVAARRFETDAYGLGQRKTKALLSAHSKIVDAESAAHRFIYDLIHGR